MKTELNLWLIFNIWFFFTNKFGKIKPNTRFERNVINHILASALIKILRPIVRMLLKRKVSYGTFAEIAKWVYADVAKREFELPGKKISDTRVSVITGLTRHDVKNLLVTSSPEEFAIEEKHNRVTSVISGWRLDKNYLDEKGEPKVLDAKGVHNSLEKLVKDFAGDVTFRAIYDELVQAGAIELLPNQKIKLKTKVLITKEEEGDKISILGEDVSALIQTINHNIEHKGSEDYLQLTSSVRYLPKEREAFIRNEVKKKGIRFIEDLDAWLVSQEIDPKSPEAKEYFSGGLGLFYFEKEEGGAK